MSHTKEDLLRLGIMARDIRHSQHRRAQWGDYNGIGLYMVTLCVEGRSAVFGRLEGDIRAARGTKAFPHLVPTDLGRIVLEEEIPKIHGIFPQVEVWQVALMPDHIHLLLYIREPLPPKKRLGNVVGGFMGGCSRAWWRRIQPEAKPREPRRKPRQAPRRAARRKQQREPRQAPRRERWQCPGHQPRVVWVFLVLQGARSLRRATTTALSSGRACWKISSDTWLTTRCAP